MTIKKETIFCPACGKKETWTPENKDRPFCSPRCKLIDLGDWASEQHRIPGAPVILEDTLKDTIVNDELKDEEQKNN